MALTIALYPEIPNYENDFAWVNDMQLMVKTISGREVTIDLGCLDTTRQLKGKIQDKKGDFPECVVFGGRQLVDTGLATMYGVDKGSTVWLTAKLRGGRSGGPSSDDSNQSDD